MLASAGPLPEDEGRWAFEPKWAGVRPLAEVEAAGRLRVWSRRGSDLVDRFPELGDLARELPADSLVDGELVTFAGGRPDFEALRRRVFMGTGGAGVTFVAFDVLRLGGRELVSRRWAERRRVLEELDLGGASWVTTPSWVGEGDALLEATREHALEGVMAKRLDSPYRPGVRTTLWRKTKHYRLGRFVVGGIVERSDGRTWLVLGSGDGDGRLRYAGMVEAYADVEELRQEAHRSPQPTLDWAPRETTFLEHRVVAEVRYLASDSGSLRHATLTGWSIDSAGYCPGSGDRSQPGSS
jgi:bifunctional non-homologous end joining protein LigD